MKLVSSFRSQFISKLKHKLKFFWNTLLRNKHRMDLTSLDIPISSNKIKRAILILVRTKSKGLMVFLCFFFFQKYWSIIGQDLVKLGKYFYNGVVNLKRINWASIALIPKIDNVESLMDFRSISHINSTLKIISKVLATRLS